MLSADLTYLDPALTRRCSEDYDWHQTGYLLLRIACFISRPQPVHDKPLNISRKASKLEYSTTHTLSAKNSPNISPNKLLRHNLRWLLAKETVMEYLLQKLFPQNSDIHCTDHPFPNRLRSFKETTNKIIDIYKFITIAVLYVRKSTDTDYTELKSPV